MRMTDKELAQHIAYVAMQLADLARGRLKAVTAALEFAAFLAQEKLARTR